MRYAAPPDVSAIHLSIGPLTVVDGFIEVPDGLSQGDLGGLAVNGFSPAPPASSPPTKASARDSSAATEPEIPTT